MRIRILLPMFLLASVLSAQNATNVVDLGDWQIIVPSNTEVQKREGPDFDVTYFVFKEIGAEFGIYVGGHPRAISDDQDQVQEQRDKIGNQDVVWRIWKTKTDEKEVIWAETVFTYGVIKYPEIDYSFEQLFHVFLNAPNEESIKTLQDVVRTLKKKSP